MMLSIFEFGSSGSLIKSGGLYELIQYVFFSQYQTISIMAEHNEHFSIF